MNQTNQTPQITCHHADALQFMPVYGLSPDLIIADPPFNINHVYLDINDNLPPIKYLTWTEEWITMAVSMLKQSGNLLICMDDKYVSDIDMICRSSKLHRQNWIIWHYGFGQSGKLDTRKKFTKSKMHILRYTKNKHKYYFDAPSVAVKSFRQLKYNDKRADNRGKCPDDVFIMPRIAGTHKERIKGVSTQIPINLLKIWINAMCPPDGLVFDPFSGSGNVLLAAKSIGRNSVGCEISNMRYSIIHNRINAAVSHNNTAAEYYQV